MVAIIDYRAGNLKSVERALNKIGVPCRVTSDKNEINSAERIIFPGVGAAGQAMANLRETGLDKVITEAFESGKPILGICLGAQIVLERSEENDSTCLGLVEGSTRRFPEGLAIRPRAAQDPPHGLERRRGEKKAPCPGRDRRRRRVLFCALLLPRAGERVVCPGGNGLRDKVLFRYRQQRNLLAMQFHPEKSGPAGLRILRNFCSWDGHA